MRAVRVRSFWKKPLRYSNLIFVTNTLLDQARVNLTRSWIAIIISFEIVSVNLVSHRVNNPNIFLVITRKKNWKTRRSKHGQLLSIFAILFIYINCLYISQFFSIAIFFVIVFSINSRISVPSNNQTLPKLILKYNWTHMFNTFAGCMLAALLKLKFIAGIYQIFS